MDYFSCKNKIPFRGARLDMQATMPSLVECILEASLMHTETTSRPMKWFSDNMVGFLLTNWQVKILKYPLWNEEFTINTWPTFFKGILAERSFEVINNQGELLALVNSAWVYSDLVRRRPIKLEDRFFKEYGELRPSRLEKDYKISSFEFETLLDEYTFITTRRDMDKNLHVNNITYLEWAINGIPDDVYDKSVITSMKCAYKKECTRGQNVLVQTFSVGKLEYLVKIFNITEEKQLLCEVFLSSN